MWRANNSLSAENKLRRKSCLNKKKIKFLKRKKRTKWNFKWNLQQK